jgi:FkbM family methyltransferase
MPLLIEAGARLAFAYARNQHGLRDKRPLTRFVARNLDFLAAGRRRRHVQAEMAGLQVLLPTSDRTIARSVYASGDWDPLLAGSVFDALERFGHQHEGTVLLEIGANFGVYSLPAVSQFGFARAVAYEPDPGSFALLEHNIERNGLGDRVVAHHAALSAQPGELTLSLGTGNAGDNRIVETDGDSRRFKVKVPARTFDDEVAAGRIPLDELGLVWLDVQGHEGEVLAGASSLLSSKVPLVMEYSAGMMDDAAVARLNDVIATRFDVMVDLSWCALVDRLRFQPTSAIHTFAGIRGRTVETDLLLLNF